jgi:uncharacterized protein YcbX
MAALSEIVYYPIKSCGGISVSSARVTERGLACDRRYMLVDDTGRFLSQREHPQMALIAVSESADGYVVEAPGRPALELPREMPVVRECPVRVWRSRLDAALADAGVNRWFSDYLGFDCGLVYMAEHHHRAVPHASAEFEDQVSFADGAPLLMISDASLGDLNARLAAPVSMRQFRPNLVVTAGEAFAEDGWRSVRIGETRLDVAWPCSRCVLTTVDPATGVKDAAGEPLETLKGYRRRKGGVMFGQNVIPRQLGRVCVGDRLTVESIRGR